MRVGGIFFPKRAPPCLYAASAFLASAGPVGVPDPPRISGRRSRLRQRGGKVRGPDKPAKVRAPDKPGKVRAPDKPAKRPAAVRRSPGRRKISRKPPLPNRKRLLRRRRPRRIRPRTKRRPPVLRPTRRKIPRRTGRRPRRETAGPRQRSRFCFVCRPIPGPAEPPALRTAKGNRARAATAAFTGSKCLRGDGCFFWWTHRVR